MSPTKLSSLRNLTPPKAGSRSEQLRERRKQQSLDRYQHVTGGVHHLPHRTSQPGRDLRQIPIHPDSKSSLHGGKKSHRTKLTTKNATAPLVFTRNNQHSLGAPVLNRAKTHVRRKYSIPLRNEGVEIRMPALPILRPGWRLISGPLLAALVGLFYFFCTAPQFRIGKPVLHGLQQITPNDVEVVLNLSNVPIFMIDPQIIREKIESNFPELTGLSIQVGLPAKVVISAKERQPVLVWIKDKKVYWIDEEGVAFPPRGELKGKVLTISAEEDPPFIQESTANPQIDQEGSTASILTPGNHSKNLTNPGAQNPKEGTKSASPSKVDPKLLTIARQLNKVVPTGTILTYSSQNGLGWKDPGGWDVYIGTTLDDLEMKLVVYQSIVKEMKRKGIQPSMVNIAFLDAPFYKP